MLSPAITGTPKMIRLPNLDKRAEKAKEKSEKRNIELKRRTRSLSLGDDVNTGAETLPDNEQMYPLSCEDDQWERKKLLSEFHRNNNSSCISLTSQCSDEIIDSLSEKYSKESTPIGLSITYGIIQAVMLLPVMMSFGNIIYHDPAFRPYLPVLVKLAVISSAVHQLTFTTKSSLPFAVGQVQDAGLIFLSAMASSMVEICRSKGLDDSHLLATVTIGLGLYTALLGIALVVIGWFNLANYVRYLPMPVVGGYLAFIGFFCGQSGLALMANVEISGLLEWYKAFQPDVFLFVLPGVLGGIWIYTSMRIFKHMGVLPVCIIAILILFYAVLLATGMTIEDARDFGWINQAEATPVWYKTWDYFQFDKVEWSALPPQIITFLSMVFVVALSSSLDVAAIELEMKRPLNYNYELKTVGLSNILSGLTGGYTGSYIFSQTILNLRAGIKSRLCGYVIVIVELLFVVIPVPLISYVPNFFFGSVLVLLCVDLMYEWLWEVRLKVTIAEYGVSLATFILIQVLGVEYGIIAGALVYVAFMKLGLNLGNDDDAEGTEKKHIEGSDDSVDAMKPSESGGSLAMFVDYGAIDSTNTIEDINGENGTDPSLVV